MAHPCNNCPWRKDAPRSHWDPQHFRDIYRSCQDDGLHVMLCHKATAVPEEQRGNLICRGWVRVMGCDSIGVRLLLIKGTITHEDLDVAGGPELFKTFDAMLKANRIPLPARNQRVPVVKVRKRQRR